MLDTGCWTRLVYLVLVAKMLGWGEEEEGKRTFGDHLGEGTLRCYSTLWYSGRPRPLRVVLGDSEPQQDMLRRLQCRSKLRWPGLSLRVYLSALLNHSGLLPAA